VNRLTATLLALLVAVVAQVALAPALSIGDVVPNFLLILVVTVALVEGPVSGATAGFAAGLLFDLVTTGPVGPMALVLTITGYVAGLIQANMFAAGWLGPLTVLFLASLASSMAYGVALEALGLLSSFWRAFLLVMLPSAVYNTALALLIYPWLARFLRRERPMQTFGRLR
jgi:rod shape-determining protein MreD